MVNTKLFLYRIEYIRYNRVNIKYFRCANMKDAVNELKTIYGDCEIVGCSIWGS